ncbi:hypothetical protein BT69DRAFT_25065 [Atractiella rhizophila]|nr:hypothetical protein BT69DRAFT_25065 [Atractiella rhizophila]
MAKLSVPSSSLSSSPSVCGGSDSLSFITVLVCSSRQERYLLLSSQLSSLSTWLTLSQNLYGPKRLFAALPCTLCRIS